MNGNFQHFLLRVRKYVVVYMRAPKCIRLVLLRHPTVSCAKYRSQFIVQTGSIERYFVVVTIDHFLTARQEKVDSWVADEQSYHIER
jgi:hypothetical protein